MPSSLNRAGVSSNERVGQTRSQKSAVVSLARTHLEDIVDTEALLWRHFDTLHGAGGGGVRPKQEVQTANRRSTARGAPLRTALITRSPNSFVLMAKPKVNPSMGVVSCRVGG